MVLQKELGDLSAKIAGAVEFWDLANGNNPPALMDGDRLRFLVGPVAGRTGRVLGPNPENDAQLLVELDDGTTVKKAGRAKIAALGDDASEGKIAEVIAADETGPEPPLEVAGAVAILVSMGFQEADARVAWEASHHDQPVAVELLLRAATGQRASPDEERSSARAAAAGVSDMDDQEKLNRINALLNEGNALMQRGDFRRALAKFEECRACGRTIHGAGLAQKVEGAAVGSLGNAYRSLR